MDMHIIYSGFIAHYLNKSSKNSYAFPILTFITALARQKYLVHTNLKIYPISEVFNLPQHRHRVQGTSYLMPHAADHILLGKKEKERN